MVDCNPPIILEHVKRGQMLQRRSKSRAPNDSVDGRLRAIWPNNACSSHLSERSNRVQVTASFCFFHWRNHYDVTDTAHGCVTRSGFHARYCSLKQNATINIIWQEQRVLGCDPDGVRNLRNLCKDLRSTVAATDHNYSLSSIVIWLDIMCGMDLLTFEKVSARDVRNVGMRPSACGAYDCFGSKGVVVCCNFKMTISPFDRRHPYRPPYRQLVARLIACEILEHIVARWIPFMIWRRHQPSGQRTVTSWRKEPQRIPAMQPSSTRTVFCIENNKIRSIAAQVVAQR